MKILSVKMVDEYLEIKAEINNGGIVKEVTWYYSPAYRGHIERVDSDVAMKNPIGQLFIGLLIQQGDRLELDEDSRKAVEEMEAKL
jgi:hypothetical protein